MSNRIKTCCLMAACCMTTLATGCLPDDSLEWSADGSVGLLRVDEALCLVDGQTGQLTQIHIDGQAGVMPDISADGKRIAYVRERSCQTVQDGLKAFTPTIVNQIKRDAKELAGNVLGGAVSASDLPKSETAKADRTNEYHQWVVRAMVADPSPELAARIGDEKLAECRGCELTIYDLVVADRTDPNQKQILTSMPTAIYRPRFSPNARHVAYLVMEPSDMDKIWLAVVATAGDTGPVEVAEAVAIGYDWRPDGKALAYAKQEGDEILAVVKERVVLDQNDVLLTNEMDPTRGRGLYELSAAGPEQQFAGTLFSPTIYVQYAPGGRVLFSSAAVQIPTSDLDEPQYSLFCYDRVTGTVTSILPTMLQNQASATMSFFSLSPDGTRVLVSLPSNRFAIYELGKSDAVIPIEEDEGFGEDDLPKFLPQWKGNDQIVCLVSEKSHFLVGDDGQPHGRKEIVVLGVDGKFQKVLSADWWPDEAIPSMDD